MEVWTSLANDNQVTGIGMEYNCQMQHGTQAQAKWQVVLFEDVGSLALQTFQEVAHLAFFTLDSHLEPHVIQFHNKQLSWIVFLFFSAV